jgi:phage terminase small subunit
MNRDEVLTILRRDNPQASGDIVAMYADCFLDYREAADNITKNGNIVLHPRTGSPIENPYIKVKAASMNQLRKMGRLKNVGALWL